MNWNVGDVIHGFRLRESRMIKEIQSMGYWMEHVQTGAQLLYIKNEDDNKVFSISFRTPPSDSTGVAHIVEHSVLCGSRKFPLKEPFVELVKGSLNTFLNAMTFPDKTMYPIASRNDKDFHNLMDVYLDAVFYPSMHNEREILMQEGWHYEIDENGELAYRGVVYNEMKGALSSPESLLDQKIMESLFPDTTYGYESGGDPDVIPDLTQEAFLSFHRAYYHPSNSYIFLYGDCDIEEKLAFIDSEYLSNFTRLELDSTIAYQKLFDSAKEVYETYPISAEEDTKDKTFLSLNYIVGDAKEVEVVLAMQILSHLLLKSQAAPLKKALSEAGIGKDVSGSCNDGLLQPTFSIWLSGANQEDAPRFTEVVKSTLRDMVANGIDKQLIEASLNLIEFKIREADFGRTPKGLIYGINVMNSWLYDESPFLYLEYEEALANIKTALHTDYFERLIEERILNNTHETMVALVPEIGLAERKATELREKLAAYKKTLTAEDIARIEKDAEKLAVRQETPDSPEALSTIPLLSLDDLEKEEPPIVCEEKCENGVTVLHHNIPTNKITYLSLYFDASVLPQEDLMYGYLLAELLGKVDTARSSYEKLANRINLETGGIGYDLLGFAVENGTKEYDPRLRVKSKVLTEKTARLTELLAEILTTSRFDDMKRMKELIGRIRENVSMYLLKNGHQVAVGRALSYVSAVAQYNASGIVPFFEFIDRLEKNFDAEKEVIAAKLSSVASILFSKQNLVVSVTADTEDYDVFRSAWQSLDSALTEETHQAQPYVYEFGKKNEGLMTAGKVQYVVKGANFRQLGYSYSGVLKVVETILKYDHLWNKIRVQGGAYGALVQFRRNGNMILGSYRDPNLAETVEVFDTTGDYLANFDVPEREMTKYIIGTMSGIDMPLTPAMKGEAAAECFLRGISHDDLQAERNEILGATQADIRAAGELIRAAMAENCLCVVGSEEKIRGSEAMFGSIASLMK
ncbi:MAG: insulinase family protein [Selenomonadales bacterium]|nr:insulinase family protein [Selenomonadales bacterium]